MSVPERKPNERSFYGRSYPRANLKLDGQNGQSACGPLANAPLIDWAKKAEWKHGGSHQSQKQIALPKAPFTPLYAFLAAMQLKIRKENPSLSLKESLVLAKADAASEWEKLTDKERELYVTLAQEDSQRYEDEAAEFKQRHPDVWASRKKRKAKAVKLPTKPKAVKTAWQAFLEEYVQNAVIAGQISEDAKGLAAQIEVMKDAAKAWKDLSDEDKQPYKEAANEDRKRFEADLHKFPAFKASLQEKAELKAAGKRQHAAKTAIYKEAEGKDSKQKSKTKPSTRPARKRALPKPKPLVKNGEFVGKGSEGVKRSKRSKKKSKVLSEKELAEGDSENEEAEVVIQYDDNSDEDVYSESEPSDNEAIASEEEDEDYALNSEDENGDAPQSDAEPDLSEDEDDQADKENQEPMTAGKLAIHAAQFVADTPAVKGDDEEDDLEEDANALRTIEQPSDLLKSDAAPKDGIFSWARSALMSGFKGMWARGGSQTPAPETARKSSKGCNLDHSVPDFLMNGGVNKKRKR